MNKKYELVKSSSISVNGKTLFRVRALKSFGSVSKGDLGGYIESEDNLDHYSNAWVSGDARVFGNAWVSGDAEVSGNAVVSDNAWVYGNAKVAGNAVVSGDASVLKKHCRNCTCETVCRYRIKLKELLKDFPFNDSDTADVLTLAEYCSHYHKEVRKEL